MATVAAIYIRVPVKDDTSNARQLEGCEAYCKAEGWKVGADFQERGVTGTGRRDRPQWRKLEAAVNGGEVRAAAAFAISRAARNTVALLRFAENCAERGVVFESVSEPSAGSTARSSSRSSDRSPS